MNIPVVILGLNNTNAIGIIRSLGEERISVFGINLSKEKEFAYHSKYLTKRYYSEVGINDEQLLDLLLKHSELHGALLIPSSDEMVIFIDKYKNDLKSSKYLIGDIPNLSVLLNKDAMKDVAEKAGFNIPRIYGDLDNIKEEYFPVFIKPINSLGYTKEHLKVVNNKEEMKQFLSSVNVSDFMCEEFIPGDATSMFEILAYRVKDNKGKAPCVIKKKRISPQVIGSSSYIETTNNSELKEMSIKFLDLIDYSGIADVEVKYNENNNSYYFIEINYRPGGPIYLAKKAGVNIPYLYYKEMIGESIEQDNCKTGIRWMHDMSDWKNIGKSISLSEFLIDLFKTNSFAFFNLKDLKPFIYTGIFKVRRIIKTKN